MKRLLSFIASLSVLVTLVAQSPTELKVINGTQRLFANGNPYLLLCGELHNSTSSTRESLEAAMKTLKAMQLNSVITTLGWEQFEPEEGRFDYSVIDYTIQLAVKYEMRIVLAWFGSWKNGESSYVPMWVKQNTRKYFHAKQPDGTSSSMISPFCKEACKADARAFAQLMRHIKKTDTHKLISVVQVENEVGVFMDMDHGKEALQALNSDVPQKLISYLQKHKKVLGKRLLQRWAENGYRKRGTWLQLFGDNFDARQFLMSYAYAEYLEEIAKAGKEIYALPMYTNCWLASSDDKKPGRWSPCGGPQSKVIDIYKAAAPSLDWLSPDIYNPDFRNICQQYHRFDNPLFIPETSRTMGPAYYAFAEHNAMCFAPFAIEDTYNAPYLLGEYQTLSELLPVISENQGKGNMHGFVRQANDTTKDTVQFTMGDYRLEVHYIKGEKNAHGLIIQTGKDQFLVAGVGCFIKPKAIKTGMECRIGFAEEIEWKGSKWHTKVILNGDQTAHHSMLYLRGRMPNAPYKSFGFDIPAPYTDVSSQRMHLPEWQNRFKYSGVYKMSLYSYPL